MMATAAAMRAFGAKVEKGADGVWRVHGLGTGGLLEPEGVIDFGNAGTGVRLAIGIAGAHAFATTFVGDASLSRRPMGARARAAARHGRRGDRPLRRPAAAHDPRRRPDGADRLSRAGALGAGEVGGAARRAQHRGHHHRHRAGRDARPHRAHAEGLWRRHHDRAAAATARRSSASSGGRS